MSSKTPFHKTKLYNNDVVLHLEQDGVAPEELELVHLGHGERHHGVVIVHRVLDNQTVGPLLLVQNGSGELVSVKILTNERRVLRVLTNERALLLVDKINFKIVTIA